MEEDIYSFSHDPYIERYYKKRYMTDVGGLVGNDHCILCHSNKVCVVTISKLHPIVTGNKEISKVDFKITERLNRTINSISGKKKKGAQKLNERSPICKVDCSDGTSYNLYACVRGLLIEANERLMEAPQVLQQCPETEGYICIILTKLKEDILGTRITEEDYLEVVKSRSSLPVQETKDVTPPTTTL